MYKAFLKNKKCLELVSLPHFCMIFEETISHVLTDQIIWLPLLPEMLGIMCIATACFPGCDVINFKKLTLALLSNSFPTWPEKSG